MASQEHLTIFRRGQEVWNQWRDENPEITPDLSEANLVGQSYSDNDGLVYNDIPLLGANLTGYNFSHANLQNAILSGALLTYVYLDSSNLSGAQLDKTNLERAKIHDSDLRRANLEGANLYRASLYNSDLSRAILSGANLIRANLSKAVLEGADLMGAQLVETNLRGSDLTYCAIYGISAWKPKLEGATQANLIITPPQEPAILVDNLEVAQFIYLLLHNEKIRHAIDTITSKVVLILGNFSEERKRVLDAMRDDLRKHDYVPVLFDFSKPSALNYEETITLLARMARFIIADVTDAKEIRAELTSIAKELPSVPVRPLLLAGAGEWTTFEENFRNRPSVLPLHRYDDSNELVKNIRRDVVAPAEKRARELRGS